jgi:hypothetical protein
MQQGVVQVLIDACGEKVNPFKMGDVLRLGQVIEAAENLDLCKQFLGRRVVLSNWMHCDLELRGGGSQSFKQPIRQWGRDPYAYVRHVRDCTSWGMGKGISAGRAFGGY